MEDDNLDNPAEPRLKLTFTFKGFDDVVWSYDDLIHVSIDDGRDGPAERATFGLHETLTGDANLDDLYGDIGFDGPLLAGEETIEFSDPASGNAGADPDHGATKKPEPVDFGEVDVWERAHDYDFTAETDFDINHQPEESQFGSYGLFV